MNHLSVFQILLGVITMWKKEISRIFKNKMLLGVLIAVACIPILYGSVFLGSVWDPYKNLHHIKVAIVNEDKAATLEGEKISLGDELAKKMSETDSLNFIEVDKKQAEKGMTDGTYYMKITIPADFSTNATTLMSNNPKKMQLDYENNPGRNYISGTITESAAEKINTDIKKQVTETYTAALFEQLGGIGEKMAEAGQGANELVKGTTKLEDGSQLITKNLTQLSDSSIKFVQGANTLEDGMSAYINGVNQVDVGVTSLNSGIEELSSQLPMLVDGSTQLANGSTELSQGIVSYVNGTDQVSSGIKQLNASSEELVTGTKTVANGLAALNQVTASLPTNIEQLKQGNTQIEQSMTNQLEPLSQEIGVNTATIAKNNQATVDTATNITQQATEMVTTASDIDQQISTIQSEITTLASQTPDASTQQSLLDLAQKMSDLMIESDKMKSDAQKLSTTSDTLTTNANTTQEQVTKATTNANVLNQGMKETIVGIQTVNKGINDLSIQAPILAESVEKLAQGSSSVSEGVSTYTQGVKTLSAGTDALKNNSSGLVDGSQNLSSNLATMNDKLPVLNSGVGQLSGGGQQLTAGLGELSSKDGQLLSGINELTSGATQISAGSAELGSGSQEITNGLKQVGSGGKTLVNQLKQGSKEIEQSSQASSSTIDMFATPVELKHTEYSEVKNYGSGLAPYFLSVALFVGALAFNVIYSMGQTASQITSYKAWWKSKMLVLFGQAITQALILATIMKFAMGIQTASLFEFYLVAICSSIASMAFVTWLNVTFDTVGKGLSIVFLVLQLGSSGGTFPLETSSKFYQVLNPLFPISYSVQGLRQALFHGLNQGEYLQDILMLLAFILAFSLLLLLTYKIKFKKNEIIPMEEFTL